VGIDLNTLIDGLLNAGDMLSACDILKKIDSFLIANHSKRSYWCKTLSNCLINKAMMVNAGCVANNNLFSVIPPCFSVQPYLTTFGMRTGKVKETIEDIRNIIDFVSNNIVSPSGKYLSIQDAKDTITKISDKFPYFDIVGKLGILNILLLDNTHTLFNSLCGVNAEGSGAVVIMYHMNDKQMAPVYVFLHELGHVLQIAMTGSVNYVPDSFIRFHERLSTGLKQGMYDAPEVFADSFAIAVMYNTPLQAYNPFNFNDKLNLAIELFFYDVFNMK
jgi:hypothetical protein